MSNLLSKPFTDEKCTYRKCTNPVFSSTHFHKVNTLVSLVQLLCALCEWNHTLHALLCPFLLFNIML